MSYKYKHLRPTVDLVIFASSNFREFLILGLLTKFRIRKFFFFFSIYYNNFREILEFANLSSSRNSRKLKPCEYYPQIHSILYNEAFLYAADDMEANSRPSLHSMKLTTLSWHFAKKQSVKDTEAHPLLDSVQHEPFVVLITGRS